jgi:hypothetical protein
MFQGTFLTGPARYTNQASQTYLSGGGTSNFFLHGDVQLAFATPKDDSQAAGGVAALIVKNVDTTGNELDLNLLADPSSRDRAGRFTRFSWTVSDSSGGTFTNAVGEGTLEIRYRPGGKIPAHATSAGKVALIFQGTVNTNGVQNILRV